MHTRQRHESLVQGQVDEVTHALCEQAGIAPADFGEVVAGPLAAGWAYLFWFRKLTVGIGADQARRGM